MKVAIINKSDIIGGAAIFALRLCNALCDNGIDAKMLVMEASASSPQYFVAQYGNSRQNKRYFLSERINIFIHNKFSRSNLFKVSTAESGYDIATNSLIREADIIILNWINQGALSLKGVENIAKAGKPIIWLMHDMWECTGICHLPFGCEHYKIGCGECPFLKSSHPADLSKKVFKQKEILNSNYPIQYVAVSNWLADRCKESALLKGKAIKVIHNCIEIERYNYTKIDIPGNKSTVIAFGAARLDDTVKGFDSLIKVTELLEKDSTKPFHLLLFGKIKDAALLNCIKIPFTYLGYIPDSQEILNIYQKSDIVLSTSRFETFGGTILEGMASGCIPVTFGNGGQKDIVEHKKNGYIATPNSPESIIDGLKWALESMLSREFLHNEAKKKFSANVIAKEYISLFNELANKNK